MDERESKSDHLYIAIEIMKSSENVSLCKKITIWKNYKPVILTILVLMY